LSVQSVELRLHPRVAQQGVTTSVGDRLVAQTLPKLQPFRDNGVHSLVALLDWDHRLPSQTMTLRLHLFYDAEGRSRFDHAWRLRQQEISTRDLYPEFDVPDLGGLPSDESYDGELTPAMELEALRLTSPWRREVPEADGEAAIAVVRADDVFAKVKAATTERAPHLGDLEAVAWTAPCESGLSVWTLDVWWLTAFDGRLGRGWSFLVDVPQKRVMSSREFTIRAGG
jgi:hypothetical protein